MTQSAARRVLIVEDDETVRGFLIRALEGGGFQPIGVRTGEEALDVVRSRPGVEAALIDGILPDTHGVRLAEAIIDDPAGAGVAICFVTGALRENHVAVAGVGALGKPLRLAELLTAVESLLTWRDHGDVPVEDRRTALRRLEHGFLVGP
jgi:two-component system cell cycle response regulator CpdR